MLSPLGQTCTYHNQKNTIEGDYLAFLLVLSMKQKRIIRPEKINKPRVLLVGPIYPKGGGVGMVNKILSESLMNGDFEIDILDTGRGQAGQGKEATLAFINLYYFIIQSFKLLRKLLLNRPKIIHQSVTWGIAFWKESFFILLARSLGVKVVAHIHGSKLDVQFRESDWGHKCLMKIAFSIPNLIIVLSEYWQKLIIEEISSTINTVIIPNSIEWSIVEAMDRNPLISEEKGCLVLFLGWLSMRKGILDALHAAELIYQQVPGIRFVFAGPIEPGPQIEIVKLACEKASLTGCIYFPGIVSGEEKVDLFSKASIFILPSYHENLPVAILEAMAMGLPVVATSVAGVPELIQDGCNGYLIQPGNYLALAERIIHLAINPKLRQSMGEANKDKIRKYYHPKVFALKIEQLYKDLLET